MSNITILIIGISITFVATAVGAAFVFVFKNQISKKLSSVFLGFAAGVMIAASIWSLILPAFEYSDLHSKGYIPVFLGFILGGAFIVAIDWLISHLKRNEESISELDKKPLRLFIAVTVHNIPEGLAVGIAFGAAIVSGEGSEFFAALTLSLGIAIQNLPEGAAISLPMKSRTSTAKSFNLGAVSGIVEPIFALLGIFLATRISSLMPWMLSFAAGAMIFVAADDLIPDSKLKACPHLGAWAVLIGFGIMMVLDVLLG